MKRITISGHAFDWAILLPALILLVAFKVQHLPLPSFWDEAWSYLPAILSMADTGPTLLPDPRTAELFRGHPLFFYFVSSLWINLAGPSFTAMRILPLAVSAGLLIAVYFFAKKYFGQWTAAASTVLLLVQPVFLAQSSMLLPEMLLALFTLLALDAFLSGKRLMYVCFGTLMALTKESGLVLLLACPVISAGCWILKKDCPFLRSWHLALPLAVTAIFYAWQRIVMGWFFFPEHIGYISFSASSVLHKLGGYAEFLFVASGRNILSILAGLAIIALIWLKWKPEGKVRPVIPAILLFSLAYLLFLSLNFYSPRYLLSMLPLFMVLCVFAIFKAAEKYWHLRLALFAGIAANFLWFAVHLKFDADHNLGFADAIRVHREVVRWLEDNHFQQTSIATHFLLSRYLSYPPAGYLSGGETFGRVTPDVSAETELAIISSTEFSRTFMQQIKDRDGTLVKRFKSKNSWSEIYRIGPGE